MKRRLPRSLAVLSTALVCCITLPQALACGPFFLDAIFSFSVHPDLPLDKFAAGKMGLIQPGYARSYLFAAYRQLNGKPFTADEQKVLLSFWKDRKDSAWSDFDEDWPKTWLETRKKIVPGAPEAKVSVFRHRDKPNEYDTYLNCQKDAFVTAASTLQSRAQQFGADSQIIKDWVAAQDQVFANCSEGQTIPAEAAADAPLPISTAPAPIAPLSCSTRLPGTPPRPGTGLLPIW